MQSLIEKTFGGLTKRYYFTRLAVTGVIFCSSSADVVLTIAHRGGWLVAVPVVLYSVVSWLLSPYAMFVFEELGSLIRGGSDDRTIVVLTGEGFFIATILKLMVKLAAIAFSYMLAIAIAPFGLAYLYFHHTRALTSAR